MDLTKKETDSLRVLYWAFQEAQGALNKALNDIAISHNLDLEKERWNVSADFKRFEKAK